MHLGSTNQTSRHAANQRLSNFTLECGVEIANTNWFDFTDTNLRPSTVYPYTVVAVDEQGNLSPASNSVSVKTNAAGKGRAAPPPNRPAA